MLSVCLCLDVNLDGTNHNRCTQKLVVSPAQTYYNVVMAHRKPGQWDLLYSRKSLKTTESGRDYAFSSHLNLTAHGLLFGT